MRIEVFRIGLELVAAHELLLLPNAEMPCKVAARTVVAGRLPGDVAAVVALCPTDAQTAFEIGAALALGLCHDTGTDVAGLAVAVRAVVEVGVVRAASVFDEGAEGQRPARQLTAPCIADVEIPALRIDVGAGLKAHTAKALRRKHLITAEGRERCRRAGALRTARGGWSVHDIRNLHSCCLRRRDTDIGDEVGAAREEGDRSGLRLDEGFRLVLHLHVRDVCIELILHCTGRSAARIQRILVVEGNALRRLIGRA